MPGTMDKADVIYGKEENVNPSTVDWNKIVTLTKPVTLTGLNVAKTNVEAAKTDPAMKKAYVKVGMISDDLYMRIKVKNGAFKKDIKEDTLLAKGYRQLKDAMAAEANKKDTPEAKAEANAKDELLRKPMGDVNAEGRFGERMLVEFDSLLNLQVKGKYEGALERIKNCFGYLNKPTVTRADATNAKATFIQIPAYVNGLEKGVAVVKAFLQKNNSIVLADKGKELAKYDHVATLRQQITALQTRVDNAVTAARNADVVTPEYRTARTKVLNDYQGVINNLTALSGSAQALLAAAQGANGYPAIKQRFDAGEAVRKSSADAFAPTREKGDIAANAYATLTAVDKADYLLDMTQAAKAANLANTQAINAAHAVLEQKLTQINTPEAQALLEQVKAAQRTMNN